LFGCAAVLAPVMPAVPLRLADPQHPCMPGLPPRSGTGMAGMHKILVGFFV